MNNLLFIGHNYHKKTKSADFIIDLLREKYDVTTFYYDPYSEDINTAFDSLNEAKFDVVVIWQITPDIRKMQNMLHSKHFVFFPMYDQSGLASDEFWYNYEKVRIICFSKTLALHLKDLGLDYRYIQYFPKPAKYKKKKNDIGIFFWQRVNKININTILSLFKNMKIDRLHMHKAIDPQNQFMDIESKKINVTYSEWFSNKEELFNKIQEFPIYIAPRPTEGIGMSFLEAMAMGCCVISANKPTMNEYITDGKNGILYNLDNITPLKSFNAERIGYNAYKYICTGYKYWEQNKYKILNWCEEPIKSNVKKYKKLIRKYKLFNILPLLSIEEL